MRACHRMFSGLLLFAFIVAPGLAGADDEPAAPAEPAVETITKDWKKNIKNKNSAHAKERGAFWEAKVKPTEKDIFYLGMIWDKAREYEKAIACFEAYLKIEGGADLNRESSFAKILDNQALLKNWDKAIAAGQEVLKLYPASKNAPGTWSDLGRVHRRKGDLEKAAAAFREATILLRGTALFDLLDLHMTAGEIDKAKAACNEHRGVFQKDAIKANFDMLEAFIGRIGQPAPSLEAGVSVGSGEDTKAYGPKPTFLYHAHVGAQLFKLRMSNWQALRSAWEENVNCLALLTLKKYDAMAQKEDLTITPEKEQEMIVKVMGEEGRGSPALLVPQSVFDALPMRWPGQMILVDAEGKLRWMRLNDENGDSYDWVCAQEALTKLTGG